MDLEMKKSIFLIFVSLFMLTGCTSVPPLNFSVSTPVVSPVKVDAELKAISVTLAQPNEQKGDIYAGMEAIPGIWKSSLEESLGRMAIFKDDSEEKLNLSVKVLAIDAPAAGFSMETRTIAKYELINRSTGQVVYQREIESLGVVPMSYAFLGVVRARESINRSVQQNITDFLEGIKTLKL
jgi:hypothetical protein